MKKLEDERLLDMLLLFLRSAGGIVSESTLAEWDPEWGVYLARLRKMGFPIVSIAYGWYRLEIL